MSSIIHAINATAGRIAVHLRLKIPRSYRWYECEVACF
jgi:hypothetical protein